MLLKYTLNALFFGGLDIMDGKPISMLNFETNFFPIGIIPMESARDLGQKIDGHIMNWYYSNNPGIIDNKEDRESLIIKASCPRFYTGDAKGIIGETVRGYDMYIVTDVGNYNFEYSMYGRKVPMSPDDHFQDLKRIIGAIGGKAQRLTVIMPILYGGRQHKRSSRESLDAAQALQELHNMGVSNVITFDAHDPRVQNATPLMGFDNAMPTYQILKALLRRIDDMTLDKDHLMVVSPDEGAMNRNIYYSSVLGLDLGMFYKRRDYSTIVNGRNPIVEHVYLGSSVKGKDILVADDIIASGESMLSLAYDLKKEGARRIFLTATYALFTEGLDKFKQAYENGVFDYVISTNLTYQSPEMMAQPWYISADLSKYIAYFILSTHMNQSVTTLLEPAKKINDLVAAYKAGTMKK